MTPVGKHVSRSIFAGTLCLAVTAWAPLCTHAQNVGPEPDPAPLSSSQPEISAQVFSDVDISAPRPGRVATTETLLSLSQIGDSSADIALSPNGAFVAFATRIIDAPSGHPRYDIVLIATDPRGEQRARVAGDGGGFVAATRDGRRSGNALARQVIWSPDSRFVFYAAERDGRVELWKSPVETIDGSSAPVAAFEGDIRRFALSADGRRLIVETSTPRIELMRRANVAHQLGFRLDERFDALYALDLIPEELAERAFWSIDLNTGASVAATREDREGLERPAPQTTAARIGPIVPGDIAHRPRLALDYYDDAGAPYRRCTAPACSGALIETWALADIDSRRHVLFQRLERAGALTALYIWDVDADAVRMVHRSDQRLLDCALGSTELFCIADAPTHPRRIIAIGLNADSLGQVRVLYDPNPHWINVALPRITRLEVEDRNGNRSFAHLVYPHSWRRGQRYPLVIVQYRSRGFLNGGTGGEYPIFPMAARGFFVLSIDRPENEALSASVSTTEWMRRTEQDGSENSVKIAQIEALIRYLDANTLIDRRRIAITGMSDGAETTYAMLNRGYPFAAAVVSTPPSDPISWSFMAGRYRQGLVNQFGLESPDHATGPWSNYWARAARYHAARYSTPVLFHLSQSEALYALPLLQRLREADVPTEAYLYPGAYHVKSNPSHLAHVQERTLSWLDFWLMDAEPSSSLDPNRTTRWQTLRARWELRLPPTTPKALSRRALGAPTSPGETD